MIVQNKSKFFRVLAATTAATVLLAGCSSETLSTPQWPEPEDISRVDIPSDAKYYDAASVKPEGVEFTAPWGSLRPDDAAPEDRVPDILKRDRIVVGVAQSLNRLGFRDPETSSLTGLEVDLAHEIAEDIFDDRSKVEFRYVESRHREEALESGDVDMVIRTMTITEPRQHRLEFSIPYLHIEERLLAMKGSGIESAADLSDKSVCASQDFTPGLLVDVLHPKEILHTKTWTDCLMALQQNQVDAVYSDDAILSGLQAQEPNSELVGPALTSGYYGIAMAAPSPDHDTDGLVRQVNSTMERVKRDGTLDRLYARWMAEYLGKQRPLPADYRTEEQSEELQEIRAEGR